MKSLGISGCTVVTFGTVGWATQQKTRTSILTIDRFNTFQLDNFEIALNNLPNKIVFHKIKPTKNNPEPDIVAFVASSIARGKISENIVTGREWYRGFNELMCSKKIAGMLAYERGGLKRMIEEVKWSDDADRLFVEAVHNAIRNIYGALAARARDRNEKIPFDREFERMRAGLMRCKNKQTLRGELANIFARGGLNPTLKSNWRELLPIYDGSDWQKARDLALLALASYSGRGSDQLASESKDDETDKSVNNE
jgi:CRISPR-associated protein Cas8a1/Csx13